MMAAMGIANNNKRKNQTEDKTTALQLKKRNEELEEQLKQSKESEEHVNRMLHAALERVRVAEEAEERLCYQLGELEAEALEQARDYHDRIVSLMNQLSQAHALLKSTNSLSFDSSS